MGSVWTPPSRNQDGKAMSRLTCLMRAAEFERSSDEAEKRQSWADAFTGCLCWMTRR